MKFGPKIFAITAFLVLLVINSAYKPLDGGMFPLSGINKEDLESAGLKINPDEIYNSKGTGLVNALVKIGGCTGSFISAEGLLITNHHCAFSALQQASSPENDYLNLGFVARSKEEEIEAKGLNCRITESYEDVSGRVLGTVSQITDPALRLRTIEAERKAIENEAEKNDSTIQAEVSEMFPGKTYVLYRYKIIRDIRLVYVPQRNIGEFGGETDNWMWPRHTGDFSFMRAYVAPDGSPADYSKDNVPYKPKNFLKVNPAGVNEDDFVFILGYPARTFRNFPSSYLKYQSSFLLPYISELYEYENKVLQQEGQKDKATRLKLATRIKRNANVLKNYKGKLKGLSILGLQEEKAAEDSALNVFIHSDDSLKQQYGSLFDNLNNVYHSIFREAYRNLWFSQIYNSTALLNVAKQINTFKAAMNALPAGEQESYYHQNLAGLEQSLKSCYASFDIDADRIILTKMLTDASNLPQNQRIFAVDKRVLKGFNKQEQIGRFVNSFFQYTRLKDPDYVLETLIRSEKLLVHYNDIIISFEQQLHSQEEYLQAEKDRAEGLLNKLLADYITVKEIYQNKSFIPDANSTLRLTYGHIRGYTSWNGIFMKPFTTVQGIIEKGKSNNPDYCYPDKIMQLWQSKDFGSYEKNDLKDIPVAMLYDTDTSGGNSGSPVLNAYGELVGVNFDRTYEATINDFAWNESYSRSIGVDIRYILWVTAQVDHVDYILREIGV